jgi:amino acid adenylation domain-containing protein/non-ribosomal peptide synthase protein (TIGR01720 family)
MTGNASPSETFDDEVLDLLLAEEGVEPEPALSIPRLEPGVCAPLSFAQRRMWILQQADPESPAYNVTAAVRLTGRLSQRAFVESLREIVRRHEVLRTCFEASGDDVWPRLQARVGVDMPLVDLSALPEPRARRAMHECAAHFAQRPFDLAAGPLLRVCLMRLAADEHVAVLCVHHIAADGWSMQVFVRELGELYAAHMSARPHALPELPVQYADYSAWQHHWLAGERLARALDYWRNRLEGLVELDLPCDRPRPRAPAHAGATHAFLIAPDTTAALETLSLAEGATLFMTLLAAFQTFLFRLSGQEDVAVGTAVANRDRRELESLIGFFVNTLVMRTDLSGRPTFRTLLARAREGALGAYQHQELPFELLVRELGPDRERGRHPLFRVMFTVDETATCPLELPGLALEPLEIETRIAKFDLMLGLSRNGDGLSGAFEYSRELFDAQTIERWAGYFVCFLEAIAEDPDRRIGELPLMSAHERAALLRHWNDTSSPYPREVGLAALFETQVAKTPDATALEFGEEQLSYRQLDERANRLAWYLRASGVGPETPVGLCFGQGTETVVAMLAVIKAGGAYVPLHPDYPGARLAYIIEDTGIDVVLSETRWAGALPSAKLDVVCLDASRDAIARASPPRFTPSIGGAHLAYVIYTSGSTGRPKGIAVPQRAVARLVLSTNYIDLRPGDRMGQASSFAFDAITFEVWGALLNGACLVGIDRETTLSPEQLAERLREARISTLFLTPALFNQVAQLAPAAFAAVRDLLLGGEALDPRWVREVLDAVPPRRLKNAYGPTETTTFATSYTVEQLGEGMASVPIGRPIANTVTYVLDDRLEPVPLGVEGELYIGGDGLARCYVGRPGQTAEQFLPHPFASRPGERLYRTGDRVRLRADGAIEFLGRVDTQVKIRGFRIEPGEIEAVLAHQPGVSAALVTMRPDVPSGKGLVAYVVTNGDDAPGPGALREHLREELPEFMVPAYYVFLDRFPVTPNGKVDRAALPAPVFAAASADRRAADDGRSEAPTTEAERAIAKVYEAVLGRDRIGVHDSYFELGGDSIIAIQLVSRLKRAGWEVSMRDLFEHPTVKSLAPVLRRLVPRAQPPQQVVDGLVPLTPIQRWFFEEHAGELHHFNQAVLLKSSQRLDERAMQRVLWQLWEHHEALRMTYSFAAADISQTIGGGDATLGFELIDLQHEQDECAALQAHADRLQGSLNLEHGPLFKAVLYRLKHFDRLLLIIHHLVVDGVSWRILLEDLQRGYAQGLQGRVVELDPETDSFHRWAQELQRIAVSESVLADQAYWSNVLGQDAPAFPPDADGSGPNRHGDSETVHTTLSPEETSLLLTQTHQAYATEVNDLLLTALGRALPPRHGNRQALISLEGHGRERLDVDLDLSRTVGWFTCWYPFLLPTGEGDLGDQIGQVRQALREFPQRGLSFGILRYLTPPHLAPGMHAPCRPQLSFNYLGQFDTGNDSPFDFAPEPSGRTISPKLTRFHDLDLVGIVADGRLSLSITFHPQRHRRESVQQQLDRFRAQLLLVAEHCSSIRPREPRSREFTYSNLPTEDFERILENFPDEP